jgi:undecaprenyl pyrophosphate synthase
MLSTLDSVLELNEPSTDHSTCLNIRILSHSDGQEIIVKLTYRLQSLIEDGLASEEALRSERVTEELGHLYGSDPDLIFIFGSQCCLDGYPPWYIKYVEIK